MRFPVAHFLCVCVLLLAVGCATTGRPPSMTLHEADSPVWSVQHANDSLTVAVSPAGRTLRVAGSAGLVLGTSVDAVVNARYRNQIAELIGEVDTAAMLEEGIEQWLQEAVGENLVQVWPLSTTAGYSSRREALAARYDGLARQNHDVLLQLRTTHGVFGHDGTLAVKIEGRQLTLPEGRTLWADTFVVTPEPVLAYDPLRDPTDRMKPRIRGARLTVERGALDKWRGGTQSLRDDLAETIEAAAAALTVSLALEENALGEYHLGKWAMSKKRFDRALEHLNKAIELRPDYADAHNALAVLQFHQGNLDAAIRTAKTVVEQWPEYVPAHVNLAWWYAIEKKDAAAARPHYQRAVELGMEPHGRLEGLLS